MTSLIDKIEHLIKREKTTPERKRKDDKTKSSSEILSEIFSAFNADPPKIEETPAKKSKKNKKKHKKEKKKRARSSSSSDSDDSDYSHKRKKRKKSKSKKHKDRSRSHSYTPARTPVKVKPDPDIVKHEKVKSENIKVKVEKVKSEPVPAPEKKRRLSIKYGEIGWSPPLESDEGLTPTTPTEMPNFEDLRLKLDSKKEDAAEAETNKGKIQIKNLKFSSVYEETVKKAEEEAKKKAKMYEEGEYTDSSSNSGKGGLSKSQFPKTSDPSGILKQQAKEEIKM